MVFYRKYRPKTLVEFDNKQVREKLARFLSKKTPPHAFLFAGPKGTGKTSAARIVAKSVNCKKKEGDACGKCDTCTAIADGRDLDILEIDAASNRGIDEIRSLKGAIKLVPFSLKYKVYIIDEVHMLTTEAFNALLKTLEEPPSHAIFILATTEPEKLLDTIVSRCVHIPFSKAITEDILVSLKRIVTGEKLIIAEDVLTYIAKTSDGSFRDATKLLEQASLSEEDITIDSISGIIGVQSSQYKGWFVKFLHEKNIKELLLLIQQLTNDNVNMRRFVQDILQDLEQKLVALHTEEKPEHSWKQEELIQALALFSHSWNEYKTALIPSIPLELAVIDYCSEKPSFTPSFSPKKKMKHVVIQGNEEGEALHESASDVAEKWDDILEALKQHNHSLVGILRSCRPLKVEGSVLFVESPFRFHADRLEEPKVQPILAEVIEAVVGLKVTVKPVLKKVKS